MTNADSDSGSRGGSLPSTGDPAPDAARAALERTCRVCGCTDRKACPGGCEWVSPAVDVCSSCWKPDPNALAAELRQFMRDQGDVIVQLPIAELLTLIGAIQLACRHPLFSGPARQRVEQGIRQMVRQLPEYLVHFRAIAAQGWNPRHDSEHGPTP